MFNYLLRNVFYNCFQIKLKVFVHLGKERLMNVILITINLLTIYITTVVVLSFKSQEIVKVPVILSQSQGTHLKMSYFV